MLLSACGGGSGAGAGSADPVVPLPNPGIFLLAGGLGGYGCLNATGTAARFAQPGHMTTDSLGNIWVEDCGLRTIDSAGVVKPDVTIQLPTDPNYVLSTPRFRLLADGYANVYLQGWSNIYADHVSQPYSVLNPLTPAPDMPAVSAYGYCQTGAEPGYGLLGIDRRGAWYCLERTVDHPVGALVKRAAGQPPATLAIRGPSVDGDASVAMFSSTSFTGAIVFDSGANGYFVDSRYSGSGPPYNSIRRITPLGAMSTLLPAFSRSGDAYFDGFAGVATANNPAELKIDGAGNVYFSDTAVDSSGANFAYIRKLTPSGAASTLAGPFPGITGAGSGIPTVSFVVDAIGTIYYFEQSQLVRSTPDGGHAAFAGSLPQPGSQDGAGSQARFAQPLGVAADVAGNVFVADCGNHTVRKVDANGNTTTLAGKAGLPGSDDGVGAADSFVRAALPSILLVTSM